MGDLTTGFTFTDGGTVTHTRLNAAVNDATVVAASATVAGKVELATDAETATGTDATRAVTPAGLQSRIGTSGAKVPLLNVANTWSAAQAVLGSDGSAGAAAGYVGEVIASTVVGGSAVALTTATVANVTSIALTAGDWEVSGNVVFNLSGTTATLFSAGFSSTSATLPTSLYLGRSAIPITTITQAAGLSLPLATRQIRVSSPTTLYLVADATFSAGTVGAYGFLQGRRIR